MNSIRASARDYLGKQERLTWRPASVPPFLRVVAVAARQMKGNTSVVAFVAQQANWRREAERTEANHCSQEEDAAQEEGGAGPDLRVARGQSA